MKELFTMWRNTRMIVLAAITGAAYAALMIPFKAIVIVPGVTELRPAAAIPVLCSFLFGPAAAWGAGFGNVIGDFVGGMIGPGSLFGFIANFLYGYAPYRAWRALSNKDPLPKGALDWVRFVFVLVVASAACAVPLGCGLCALGVCPFPVIVTIVFINNFFVPLIICSPLLYLIYPRVKQMGLVYSDTMPEGDLPKAGSGRILLALCSVVLIAGALVGIVRKASDRPMDKAKTSAEQTAPAEGDSKK